MYIGKIVKNNTRYNKGKNSWNQGYTTYKNGKRVYIKVKQYER